MYMLMLLSLKAARRMISLGQDCSSRLRSDFQAKVKQSKIQIISFNTMKSENRYPFSDIQSLKLVIAPRVKFYKLANLVN